MAETTAEVPNQAHKWRLPSRIFSYVPALSPTRVLEFGQDIYLKTKEHVPAPLTGHIQTIEDRIVNAYHTAEPSVKSYLDRAEPVLSRVEEVGHVLDDFSCAQLDRIEQVHTTVHDQISHGKDFIGHAHSEVHDVVSNVIQDPVGTILSAGEKTVDYLLPATVDDQEQEAIEEVVGDIPTDSDVELKEVKDGATLPASKTRTTTHQAMARVHRLGHRVAGRAVRHTKSHASYLVDHVSKAKVVLDDPLKTVDSILGVILGEEKIEEEGEVVVKRKTVSGRFSDVYSLVILKPITLSHSAIEQVYAALIPYYERHIEPKLDTRLVGTVKDVKEGSIKVAKEAYSAVIEQEKRSKYIDQYIVVYVRWALDHTESYAGRWSVPLIGDAVRRIRGALPKAKEE